MVEVDSNVHVQVVDVAGEARVRELRACLRVRLLLFLATMSILLSAALRARLATAGGAVLAHRIFEFYFALLGMLVQLLESQEVLLV